MNKPIALLACGSRDWASRGVIEQVFQCIQDTYGISRLIHGNCRGADKMAAGAARRLGIVVQAYPAKWEELGYSAGPKRNQQMLDEGHPDLVVAFSDNLSESKGTKDMVKRALKAGTPVWVVGADGRVNVPPSDTKL